MFSAKAGEKNPTAATFGGLGGSEPSPFVFGGGPGPFRMKTEEEKEGSEKKNREKSFGTSAFGAGFKSKKGEQNSTASGSAFRSGEPFLFVFGGGSGPFRKKAEEEKEGSGKKNKEKFFPSFGASSFGAGFGSKEGEQNSTASGSDAFRSGKPSPFVFTKGSLFGKESKGSEKKVNLEKDSLQQELDEIKYDMNLIQPHDYIPSTTSFKHCFRLLNDIIGCNDV